MQRWNQKAVTISLRERKTHCWAAAIISQNGNTKSLSSCHIWSWNWNDNYDDKSQRAHLWVSKIKALA